MFLWLQRPNKYADVDLKKLDDDDDDDEILQLSKSFRWSILHWIQVEMRRKSAPMIGRVIYSQDEIQEMSSCAYGLNDEMPDVWKKCSDGSDQIES